MKFAEFLGGGAGQTEKRKRLDQLRLALEDLKVKSFFDFSSRTEAIRGARRWGWTNRKAETTRNKHSLFPETSKLETPTKKRFVTLIKEKKTAVNSLLESTAVFLLYFHTPPNYCVL
ncbi:hypothetical protein [Mesobacillus harenae]|uniref:hypothetical protein n=1 Tax=Mesobacillus harenae TaxID=2213203 RepID=UPI001580A529|nr:hypothetical protein [Mesobacillus harenae]